MVCIPEDTATVIFDGDGGTGSSLISQLRSSAPLEITGGRLGLTDTSATDNYVGGLSLAGGDLGSTTNAEGSITDNGALSATGGGFIAPTSQSIKPTFTVPAGTSVLLEGTFLDHWALVSASPLAIASVLDLSKGGGITESGIATVADGTLVVGNPLPATAGVFAVTSGGTLTKASTGGTATLSVPVDVAGKVSVPGGTLVLGDPASPDRFGELAGPVSIDSGCSLVLNSVDILSSARGSGAGTLELNGNITDDAASAGTNVTETGGVTTMDAQLDLSGTLSVAGGEIDLGEADNVVGGLSVSGGQLGNADSVQGSLVDNGNFLWGGGSILAPAYEAPPPTLTVAPGNQAALFGGVLSHWSLAIASPLAVSGAPDFEDGGGISESATASFGDGTDLVDDGSAGSLTITSTGMLTKALTSGTAAVGIPVDISGSVDVPAGVLNLGDPDETDASGSVGGQIVVAAGALLDLEGVNLGAAASSSGSGTIELNGTISDDAIALGTANVTEASGLTSANSALELSGTLSITGGELDLAETGNAVGGFSLSGGQLGDGGNLQGSLSDNGDFEWTGGSVVSPPSESPLPTLTVAADNSAAIAGGFLVHWIVSIASPLAISVGCNFGDGGSITESAVATLADGTDIVDAGSAGPFTIASSGTLTKEFTSGTAVVAVPVNASGTIAVPSGELSLGDPDDPGASGSVGGSVVVALGTILDLDGVNLASAASVSGLGTVQLDGSVLDDAVSLGDADVTVASGVTTVNVPLEMSGMLSITGGELDLAASGNAVGGFSMFGGELGDAVNPQGSLVDNGNLLWAGGSMLAPSSQTPLPSLSVASGQIAAIAGFAGPPVLSHWRLVIASPLSIEAARDFQDGGGITASGATVLGGNTIIDDSGSAGPFVSSGAITGTGVAQLRVPVDITRTGSISMSNEALILGEDDSEGVIRGSVSIATGSSLALDSENIAPSATISGAGGLQLGGIVSVDARLHVVDVGVGSGVVTFNVPLDVSGSLGIGGGELNLAATGNKVGSFFMSGGQLGDTTNVQGSLVVEGIFDWIGGSFFAPVSQSPVPRLKASAGSTDNISGADNISNQEGVVNHWTLAIASPISIDGVFALQNGGRITEFGTATLTEGTLANLTDIVDAGSAGPFVVATGGSLERAPVGGVVTVGVPVINFGTISNGGELLTLAGLTNKGTLNLSTGIVSVSSTYLARAGSSLEVTLAGTTAGTTYGQLQVGSIERRGSLVITTSADFIPEKREVFAAVTSSGEQSGRFTPVVQSITPNGLEYVAEQTPDAVLLTARPAPQTVPARLGPPRRLRRRRVCAAGGEASEECQSAANTAQVGRGSNPVAERTGRGSVWPRAPVLMPLGGNREGSFDGGFELTRIDPGEPLRSLGGP